MSDAVREEMQTQTDRPDSGTELSRSEVRQVQLRLLDVLARMCAENGLRFFLYYGTLIGALRHKGFIPWDDDIDVAMDRQDYERLAAVDWSSYGVGFASSKVRRDYPYLPGKIYDLRTCLVEQMDEPLEGMGINIDIFPVDNLPVGELRARAEQGAIQLLANFRSLKVIKADDTRAAWKSIILSAAKSLLAPVSAAALARWTDAVASRNRSPGEHAGCRTGPYANREIMPRHLLDGTVIVEFEGRQMPAPQGYHEILTRIYGDYMVPPPPEKRITHHAFRAYRRHADAPGVEAAGHA